MKKVKNLKKNNNKINKKNVLLVGLTSAVSTIPVGVTLAEIIGNDQTYQIGDMNFGSLNSAVDYVKQNSDVSNRASGGYDAQWKIRVGNNVQTFSSVEDLRQEIYDKYITENLVKTNINLNDYTNEWGQLGIANSSIWGNIYNASAAAATVYQGLNDQAFPTAEQAYNSYFTARDSYYYNGIYFSSKEQLKDYLINVHLPTLSTTNTNNTIVLEGPNGITSSPIVLSDKNALEEISRFISNNAIEVLTYTNSNSGESMDINKGNMENLLNKVSLNDLDYLHVQSNQGQVRYVVDNDASDPNNLIGPYFYEGNLDVGSFMNKDMWKKVRGVTSSVYVESKIDSMIGSFFTSIINDDSALILSDANAGKSPPVLFRTLLVDQNLASYDEWFLNQLNTLSPRLASEVTQANINLLSGKKYNTFFKIPILYSFLMSRVVSWGLSQDISNLIVDYFTDVCNFIQDVIELVIVDDNLLWDKTHTHKFNVVDFFQIGNPEFDLNTSTVYFLEQLKTQYPNLIAVMDAYINAQNNITSLAGLIPFQAVDNSYLVNFGILTTQELETIKPSLEKMYNLFSCTTYDEMVKTYVNSSNKTEMMNIRNLPQDQWKAEFDKLMGKNSNVTYGTMLQAIGMKNSTYHTLAKSMLDLEIATFLETGAIAKKGYLDKLTSSNANYDKLPLFIKFIKDNPNADSFRAYMAFLIDKRMMLGVFNTSNISDPYEFAKALSRVVMLGLGTTGLVGSSISKIYTNGRSSTPTGRSSQRTSNTGDPFENWWSAENGDDVDVLLPPTENPLNRMFDDPSQHKNITLSQIGGTNQRMSKAQSRVSTTIDPNSPDVLQQVEVLHNPKFKVPNKLNFTGLVNNASSVLRGGINTIMRREGVNVNRGHVRNMVDFWISKIDGQQTGSGSIVLNPSDKARLKNAMDFNLMDPEIDRELLKLHNPYATDEEILEVLDKLDKTLDFEETNFGGTPDGNNPSDGTGNNGSVSGGSGGDGGDGNTGNGGDGSESGSSGNGGDGSGSGSGSGSGGNGGDGSGSGSGLGSGNNNGDGSGNNNNGDGSNRRYPGASERSRTSSIASSWGSDWDEALSNLFQLDDDDSNSNNKKKRSFTAFKQRCANAWSGASNTFESVKRAGAKIASHALELFASSFAAMEIFFFVFELLQETKTQDFYVYTTSDGTEFIWDGGLTTSKFFGLEVKEVHGISEMKLITPVQITMPQIEETYYFDQVKYYDTNDLKRKQIEYMLSGGTLRKTGAFDLSYSMFSGDSSYANKANSISELITAALNSMGIVANPDNSLNYNNLNKNSEFINLASTSFSNGLIVTAKDNNVTVANNIKDNIRSTKIAILPETINGKATGKLSSEFKLPGTYWDGSKVVHQDESQFVGKFIIDNSANTLVSSAKPDPVYNSSDFVTPDQKQAEVNSVTKLYNAFKSSFNLNTKSVLKNEELKNNFSDMLSGDNGATIYTVNIDGKKTHFANREDAVNYLLKAVDFTKINGEKITKEYRFEDPKTMQTLVFRSDKEIAEWVKSQAN